MIFDLLFIALQDLQEINGVSDAIAVTVNGDAGHEEGN